MSDEASGRPGERVGNYGTGFTGASGRFTASCSRGLYARAWPRWFANVCPTRTRSLKAAATNVMAIRRMHHLQGR